MPREKVHFQRRLNLKKKVDCGNSFREDFMLRKLMKPIMGNWGGGRGGGLFPYIKKFHSLFLYVHLLFFTFINWCLQGIIFRHITINKMLSSFFIVRLSLEAQGILLQFYRFPTSTKFSNLRGQKLKLNRNPTLDTGL